MKTVFRTPFKLNKIVKTGKDRLKRCNNKNLIYQINCKNCSKTYVGQTKHSHIQINWLYFLLNLMKKSFLKVLKLDITKNRFL